MMICGFKESSVFFSLNLAVLLTIGGVQVNSFTVIRSTTWNGNGDVDRFSNPSCYRFNCRNAIGSVCSTADCCFCQCVYSQPNYVMYSARCMANDGIIQDCRFTDAQDDDLPPPVNEITKSGKVQFRTSGTCNKGMQVTKWSYRLTGNSWIPGSPNVFKVAPVTGDAHSWILQWNRGLDAKYAGLILKFDFSCENIRLGCLLTKSKGNYTFDNTAPSDVAVDARGGKTGPTPQSGTLAGTNDQKANERTSMVETPAKTKREVEAKQTGIVIAGVTVSLAAGIVLVLVTLLLMIKRSHADGRTKGQRENAPNVAYEEPIKPSVRPGGTLRAATFLENAFYSSDCVLTISTQNAESTDTMAARPSGRLGPLPPLPIEEGIYEEPKITRNVAYHQLANDQKENNETVGDVVASEQQSLPVYNILEPAATDDDDYDDTVSVSRNCDA